MTWERHRPKALSWTLLAALLLVLVMSVWRYTAGEVPPAEDLLGILLRVVVVGLLVATYLRAGGSTTVTPEGLVVHDGIRRVEKPAAVVEKVEEDPRRNGVVAVLRDGRRLELPGVPAGSVRDVRRQLRRR
ncbi:MULTISPECIES: hypothetical protein [unclassified Ornithinimicrobium]|uniref:hypothetical protein n=1 Tax=unclassified Ornithinimicrobium TaxID=2615080 RepID=UPI003851E5A4